MKAYCLTFLLSICTLFALGQDVMDNQDVIDLHGLGFEEDVITSKINSSNEVNFETSIESLKTLKEKGVPSGVIALMIDKSKVEIELGIFFFDYDTLKILKPSVFSGTKTSALGSALSYGIASSKVKSYIHDVTSRNTIHFWNQNFIFQFDKSKNSELLSGTANWWFKAASSPQEFVLTKLTVRPAKKQRELVTGKATSITLSSQKGVDTDKTIPFDIEDLGNGRFKVTPRKELETGEYCFFYQGSVPQGGVQNQSIFDFTAR